MGKKTVDPISEAVTELLMLVTSGVNYASKLAIETGKSIPVVFKQLDELIEEKLLRKHRSGKRVEYAIQWDTMAHYGFQRLQQDLDFVAKLVKNGMADSGIVEAVGACITKPKSIEQLMNEIFAIEQIQSAFAALSAEILKTTRQMNKAGKVDFSQSLGYFLDSFGMLDQQQAAVFLKTLSSKQQKSTEEFLKLCRLHHAVSTSTDPRKRFIEKQFNR